MSAKSQLKSELREAYCFLREKNQTIPSETLDLMLYASLNMVDQMVDITAKDRTPQEETIEVTRAELNTFLNDASGEQVGWSDTSYRLARFIGIDPTQGT
jgi:hypothetical protein